MEKISQKIALLRQKISGLLEGENSGHGIDHLERVLSYALLLQKKEGGDLTVIAVASYLHDVHRIMGYKSGRFVTPKESLPTVEALLSDLDLTMEQESAVLYAIEHHEEYAFGMEKVTVTDIESKIVQDADNLDAIGAIAIVRSVKYGSAHGMKDYDPDVPFYFSDYSESVNDKSTVHHLYNKSSRLGKYLHTATARGIAEQKTKLINDFIELYVKEYNCDF